MNIKEGESVGVDLIKDCAPMIYVLNNMDHLFTWRAKYTWDIVQCLEEWNVFFWEMFCRIHLYYYSQHFPCLHSFDRGKSFILTTYSLHPPSRIFTMSNVKQWNHLYNCYFNSYPG